MAPCSRSGTACARRATRRQVDFTQAELATKIRVKYLRALEDERFDAAARRRPTSRASCARTPSTSASTASSTSTSTTRASSPARSHDAAAAPLVGAARAPHPPARDGDRAARRRASSALVTLVVVAAWQSSGGARRRRRRRRDARDAQATAAACRCRTSQIQAVHGRSYVAVHRDGADRPARSSRGRSSKGGREPFNGKRFWLNVSSPENLRIVVGGKRVAAHRRQAASRSRSRRAGCRPAERRSRAAIVVTGSELVRGDRNDLNGPFLARVAARARGRAGRAARSSATSPAELEAALRDGLARDLLVVSGGLGPTHDDRTVELLARAAGRPLRVDEELEAQIEARSRAVAERLKRPYADFAAGVRKQATVPEGAVVAGLAGTAPALVLELDGGRVAVTLPGPAARAAAALGRGARDRAAAAAARARAAARAPRAALLRRLGVGRRAGARGGRRRRRRRRGDDLRARLRDPRRPLRRARRGGARRRARDGVSGAARAVPLLARPRSRSRRSCSTAAASGA